jgi:fumarate hydratase class II
MMPVTAYNLLQSISLVAAAARNFARQCIQDLKATTKGPEMVERGLAICTSLAPVIGYDAAADISKQAYKTGRTVREVAREKTKLSAEDLERILNPENMTKPGLDGGPAAG